MTHQANLSPQPVQVTVAETSEGTRLDAFLAEQFPVYSRVKLRRIINAGGVKVDGNHTKAALRLRGGENITITLPDLPDDDHPEPENIPIDVLYEDETLVAINKPPAMVVHPSKGHWSGTLTAALAYHFQNLSSVGGAARPGIVHRLDRDTSGVIVVAKTDESHLHLAAQFEARTVKKEYFAIVAGCPDRDRDVIEVPIGVHPYQREKMAVRADHHTSRDAKTFYEVAERFNGYTALNVFPKTGRTHQIRVHLSHIGCPVLCDRHYAGHSQITRAQIRSQDDDQTVVLNRQALHARCIIFSHPTTNKQVEIAAPLADDIQTLLDEFRIHRTRVAQD